jgi:hypothetical protein
MIESARASKIWKPTRPCANAPLRDFMVQNEATTQVSTELKTRRPTFGGANPSRLRNRIIHGYWSIDPRPARLRSGASSRALPSSWSAIRITPGSWSSPPPCGGEKCVYVLIVVVEAGGGVDAGDAGPRAGVVAVRVGGVVARVLVVSRELAPWHVGAGQARTWLPYIPSPHEPVAWEPFRPQQAGSIKCPAAPQSVGAI